MVVDCEAILIPITSDYKDSTFILALCYTKCINVCKVAHYLPIRATLCLAEKTFWLQKLCSWWNNTGSSFILCKKFKLVSNVQKKKCRDIMFCVASTHCSRKHQRIAVSRTCGKGIVQWKLRSILFELRQQLIARGNTEKRHWYKMDKLKRGVFSSVGNHRKENPETGEF